MKVAKIEPHQVSEMPEVPEDSFQPVQLQKIDTNNSSEQPEDNSNPHLSEDRMAELFQLIHKAKNQHFKAEHRKRERVISAYKSLEAFEDDLLLNTRHKFTG